MDQTYHFVAKRQHLGALATDAATAPQCKHTKSVTIEDNSKDESDEQSTQSLFSLTCLVFVQFWLPLTAKKKHATLGNPVDIDKDEFLLDVKVQEIHKDTPTCQDKQHDVDHFFHPPALKDVNAKTKKYCCCKSCLYVTYPSIFFSSVNLPIEIRSVWLMKWPHYITIWRPIIQWVPCPMFCLLPSWFWWFEFLVRENITNGLKASTLDQNYQVTLRNARLLQIKLLIHWTMTSESKNSWNMLYPTHTSFSIKRQLNG